VTLLTYGAMVHTSLKAAEVFYFRYSFLCDMLLHRYFFEITDTLINEVKQFFES
jgi:pyruvate/2-oxoglutarate/acetoin dehydrogenase E1 component